MKEQITTCQICARAIKSSTGVVAHHGYKRPDRGSGWQTASCAGARHLPYEVSCELLPPVIERVKAYIERRGIELKKFIANPPATLTIVTSPSWKKEKTTIEVSRPEGFVADKDYHGGNYQSYNSEYDRVKYDIERSIKWAKSDLKMMEKRLADWVQVITREDWERSHQTNDYAGYEKYLKAGGQLTFTDWMAHPVKR